MTSYQQKYYLKHREEILAKKRLQAEIERGRQKAPFAEPKRCEYCHKMYVLDIKAIKHAKDCKYSKNFQYRINDYISHCVRGSFNLSF